MKKMLSMPNSLNGRLKRIALDRGISVNRLIVDCLEGAYPGNGGVSSKVAELRDIVDGPDSEKSLGQKKDVTASGIEIKRRGV